ncbi:metal-dependent hydrolase [Aliarcobacter butzleri]|uniref:metal-dependent hydrolase n=1 Tax=Aliarcobacter butzleri TaxID=28197 RepID=UPI0021B15C10|nr:metal-dependent hydrolase [Aliarcobacter butzleri]MCT7578669.1 metal-dependent hydrolase [Aliarcobacter butzleri]MCT7647611.1 metal-dependent hydrolase [Aliarcobacter butzleri]
MTSTTHTSFALSLGLIPLVINPNLISISEIPLYVSGLSVGALFPDIDEPESYIGRRIPILPRIIKFFFGHRGLTHQFIFFLIPFFALFAFRTKINEIDNGAFLFLVGFCLGIFFHQIGDMLSGSKIFKGGIRDYFYPFVSSGEYFTPFPKIFRCVVGDIKEQIYNIFFILVVTLEFKHILNIQI